MLIPKKPHAKEMETTLEDKQNTKEAQESLKMTQ